MHSIKRHCYYDVMPLHVHADRTIDRKSDMPGRQIIHLVYSL